MPRAKTATARAAVARMREEVRAGLSRARKELPPKYFYDARGSAIFEEITRLPEYYLTRAERALLEARIPTLVRRLRPRSLVEPGAGSAAKTRIILDAMRAVVGDGVHYQPIDVSAGFLEETAARLRAEYPGLRVRPRVADFTEAIRLDADLPEPRLMAFLGSTIGNFDPGAAVRLLADMRAALDAGDRLLLGADLRKDPAIIEAAYNDARGVTADFNRNMLRVLNRDLGADFDVAAFAHRAFYDCEAHRIEMHLVSTREQAVTIPGAGTFHFAAGESIRTEFSHKFDRPSIEAAFAAAGFDLERWWPDGEGLFALAVGVPR